MKSEHGDCPCCLPGTKKTEGLSPVFAGVRGNNSRQT